MENLRACSLGYPRGKPPLLNIEQPLSFSPLNVVVINRATVVKISAQLSNYQDVFDQFALVN